MLYSDRITKFDPKLINYYEVTQTNSNTRYVKAVDVKEQKILFGDKQNDEIIKKLDASKKNDNSSLFCFSENFWSAIYYNTENIKKIKIRKDISFSNAKFDYWIFGEFKNKHEYRIERFASRKEANVFVKEFKNRYMNKNQENEGMIYN